MLRAAAVVLLPTLLAGCRLLFEIEGSGILLSEVTGTIYRDGDQLEISSAYQDRFRPVPMPGHRFVQWKRVCRKEAATCPIDIPQELAERDIEGNLEPLFADDYTGPLALTGGSFYAEPFPSGNFLRIDDSSLDIEGLHALDADLRLFLATADLSFILAGERNGTGFEFSLPTGAPPYEALWLIVSAVDSDGVLASTGLSFGAIPESEAALLSAYRQDTPYSSALVDCVTADVVFDACDMTELPLIGLDSEIPTLEDILQRTVVSHDWMGDRFRDLMQRMPRDVYRMMRGVTAVVISANIRPSFYFTVTGAIHIDPDYLWLTVAEKRTVSQAADFRSEFGNELQLVPIDLYVSGPDFAFSYFPLDDDSERTIRDTERPFAALMFHELAHANDVAVPDRLPLVRATDTMLDVYNDTLVYSATLGLLAGSPLNSEVMSELGAVLYQGLEAGDNMLRLTAAEAGVAFEGDVANHTYAYAAPQEDMATLVEIAMMQQHYGIESITAFTDMPARPEFATCDDYVVRWGQRGRLYEIDVAVRSAITLDTILGTDVGIDYVLDVPPTRNMVRGVGFCSSIWQTYLRPSDAKPPERALFGSGAPAPRGLIRKPPVLPPRR